MELQMTKSERGLLEGLLLRTRRYAEFGSGGSTVLAAQHVSQSIISVDSSSEWLDRVRSACAEKTSPIKPMLLHVDIGETKEWGWPANEIRRSSWPDYYNNIWSHGESGEADLYLIDGRFRVACFMKIVLNARPDALIAFHDFVIRPYYHVVKEISMELAVAENLSVFRVKPDFDRDRATAILNEHAYRAG